MDAVCEIENCGSHRYHLGEDGFTYCSEGHRQSQTGLVTARDDDVLPVGGATARKRLDRDIETATKSSGIEHFLLCFQVILRKQIDYFLKGHYAPAELENVTRDLWMLRLSKLQTRLANKADDLPTVMFSSQQDTQAESMIGNSKRRDMASLPHVGDGICLLYCGLVLLRYPITISSLFKLINKGELPYYRTISLLDKGMANKLQGSFHHLLNPVYKLQFLNLESDVRSTIALFESECHLHLPQINYSSCLWQMIRDLALPLELYTATLKLSQILGLSFEYGKVDQAIWRTEALLTPEKQLLASLVVTTKLLFPYDFVSRVPSRPDEPAALIMDWDEWCRESDTMDHKGSAYEKALNCTAANVIDMSANQLDSYMSWFESSFVQDDSARLTTTTRETNFLDGIKSMFRNDYCNHNHNNNVLETNNSSVPDRIVQVQEKISPARIVGNKTSDEHLTRPGNHYRRFRKNEELTGNISILYNRAAAIGSVSVDSLVTAVFALEKMAEKHL